MITIEDGRASSLAKLDVGAIARPSRPVTVGQLELSLLARFPKSDAQDWDRTGLLVGDPAALVKGVAVALDPTREAIESACKAGANVLLTHHPAFLEPPAAFMPAYGSSSVSGANVFNAITHDVALMNFHTALDVSTEGAAVLPGMLGLDPVSVLIPLPHDAKRGFGHLCDVRKSDAPLRLSHLAARCTSVFGRLPRVWGDFSTILEHVVVAGGSAGDVVLAALDAHADCLVCGEVRYHAALDASQAGLAIVELGHDVSELPLAAVLAQAVIDVGVPSEDVTIIDQSMNWLTPDSTRI